MPEALERPVDRRGDRASVPDVSRNEVDLRPALRQPLEQRAPFGSGTLAADDGRALVDETLDDRAADAAATTCYDRHFPGQPGGWERGRRCDAHAHRRYS